MVQATVDDEICLPPRIFAIDHFGDVDAAFSDDVTAQLNDDPCIGQVRRDAGIDQFGEVLPDEGEVERLVPVEVGDAEAATEVDVPDRAGGVFRERKNQLNGLSLCFGD